MAESEAEDTGMLYRTFVYRVAAGLRLDFSEFEDSQERPFYNEQPSLVCVSCVAEEDVGRKWELGRETKWEAGRQIMLEFGRK